MLYTYIYRCVCIHIQWEPTVIFTESITVCVGFYMDPIKFCFNVNMGKVKFNTKYYKINNLPNMQNII